MEGELFENSSAMNDYNELDPELELDLDPILGTDFKTYAWALLLIFGTIGNTVSLLVLRKLSRSVMSTCLYLAIQCVADLIVLFTRCGNDWVMILTGDLYNVNDLLMSYSEMLCKSMPFICGSIYHLSRWLATAAVIEGFVAARYPQSVPVRFTLTHAQSMVMLMTSFVICVNVHYFWSFELVTFFESGGSRVVCTFAKDDHRQSVYFQGTIWPALNNAVTDFAPQALVIACTTGTIASVVTGRHRGTVAHRQWRQRYVLEPDGVERLVWLHLAAGIAFIVLLLPKCVVQVVQYFNEQSLMIMPLTELSEMAEFGWLSLKALVYGVASGRFRQEIWRTFCARPAIIR